jgi:hypothetical protein
MTTRYLRGGLLGPLLLLALCAGSGASAPARADGQIYLCVNQNGQKTLTDTAARSGCKALDLPTMILAPPRRSGAGPRAGAPSAPAATPAPAAFPRVDNAQQKARDNDRRQILVDELNSEQQRLGELKKEFNNGEPERNGNEKNFAKYQERVALLKDDVGRVEKNVEALKREIANIR